MIKWILTLIFILSSTFCFAEGGNQKVYDYSGSGGGAGTTTSNLYVWDGSEWQKAKGDTDGYTYVIGTGNVTINSLPNVTVGSGSVNINDLLPIIDMLPANPVLGCEAAIMTDTIATTTATLIVGVGGQAIYVVGLHYFNRAATAGNINFIWSGGNVCYPAAVSGSIGAGFIVDTYFIGPPGEGLEITTPAAFAVIIFYKQM